MNKLPLLLLPLLCGCNPTPFDPATESARSNRLYAQSRLEVAKIDAQTDVILAKAQAQVNVLIEASIKNPKLLATWIPNTATATWGGPSGSAGVITYHHDNLTERAYVDNQCPQTARD